MALLEPPFRFNIESVLARCLLVDVKKKNDVNSFGNFGFSSRWSVCRISYKLACFAYQTTTSFMWKYFARLQFFVRQQWSVLDVSQWLISCAFASQHRLLRPCQGDVPLWNVLDIAHTLTQSNRNGPKNCWSVHFSFAAFQLTACSTNEQKIVRLPHETIISHRQLIYLVESKQMFLFFFSIQFHR